MFIFSNSRYCLRCGGTNLFFAKNKNPHKIGAWSIKTTCRECTREIRNQYAKEYRLKNKEKLKQYRIDYRSKNIEKWREVDKAAKRRRYRLTKNVIKRQSPEFKAKAIQYSNTYRQRLKIRKEQHATVIN